MIPCFLRVFPLNWSCRWPAAEQWDKLFFLLQGNHGPSGWPEIWVQRRIFCPGPLLSWRLPGSLHPRGCSWILGPEVLEKTQALFISRQNFSWVDLMRMEHLIRPFSLKCFPFSPVSLYRPGFPASSLVFLPTTHLPFLHAVCFSWFSHSHLHWWLQLPITCGHSQIYVSRLQPLSWLVFTYATYACFPSTSNSASFLSSLPLTQACFSFCISSPVKGMST